MVSVRGRYLEGRRSEGSCGLRSLARERSDDGTKGSSERARPGRRCAREGANRRRASRRASRPRGQRPPLIKLNIDTGDDWVVRANVIADFHKNGGN